MMLDGMLKYIIIIVVLVLIALVAIKASKPGFKYEANKLDQNKYVDTKNILKLNKEIKLLLKLNLKELKIFFSLLKY